MQPAPAPFDIHMDANLNWRWLTEEARGRQRKLNEWYWAIMRQHEQYLQWWIEQKQHELSALIAASTTDALLMSYSQKQRDDLLLDLSFRSWHWMHIHQLSRLREIHIRMEVLWKPEPHWPAEEENWDPQKHRFVQLWGQRFDPQERIIIEL